MSYWYDKVEYECDCGRDYGNCGEMGKFFLKYIGVSDHYQIFFQSHPEDKIERLITITDKQLSALGDLLNKPENMKCTDEEVKQINLQNP